MAEVAGFYGRITDSLRDSGLKISFFERVPHKFKYFISKNRIDYRYKDFVTYEPKSRWSLGSAVRRRLFSVHFFFWAIRNHDIFVFACGQSFLRSGLDLLILRILRKSIVSFVAHGAELRPAYMDGAHWSNALKTQDPIEHIRRTARRQRHLAQRLEKWSDVIIAHPLSSQFLSERAVCSLYIGLPIPRPVELVNQNEHELSTRIRIVHAPSDRRVKGSDLIAEIVGNICQDVGNIDYVEFHGVPNGVVLATLRNADIVVDQMYTDTRLAGLGAEGASIGVAVLSAGYGDSVLSELVDQSVLPPAPVVHPTELEKHLRRLVQDDLSRTELSQKLQDFVLSRWSTRSVAQRFWRVVTSDSPNDWFFDPQTVSYVDGAGLSQHELLDIIQRGLDRFGHDFLQLDHRQDLLSLVLEILSTDSSRTPNSPENE